MAQGGCWHFLVLSGCAVSVGSGVVTEWGCDSNYSVRNLVHLK